MEMKFAASLVLLGTFCLLKAEETPGFLSIRREGPQLILEGGNFPEQGFALEWTGTLPTLSWQVRTWFPPSRATTWQLTEPLHPGTGFYRLRQAPAVLAGGVIAPTAAGSSLEIGHTSHFLNRGNASRVWRDLPWVEKLQFYCGSLEGLAEVRLHVQRWDGLHLQVVAISENLLDRLQAYAVNQIRLLTPLAGVRRGDYVGLSLRRHEPWSGLGTLALGSRQESIGPVDRGRAVAG